MITDTLINNDTITISGGYSSLAGSTTPRSTITMPREQYLRDIACQEVKDIYARKLAQEADANDKTVDSPVEAPSPSVDYLGSDGKVSPGEDWEWRGKDISTGKGNWVNKKNRWKIESIFRTLITMKWNGDFIIEFGVGKKVDFIETGINVKEFINAIDEIN